MPPLMVANLIFTSIIYPFNPVKVIPSMRCLWARAKAMKVGSTVITVPAITRCHKVPYSPLKRANPKGKVLIDILFMTMTGQKKESQLLINKNNPKVAKAGFDKGIIIRRYMPNSEQPSIRAASIISVGMVFINCLIRYIPKALFKAGTIRAQ